MAADAVDRSFDISNEGGGELSGFVALDCSHYTILTGGGAFTLLGGESRTVSVRFEPTVPGTHSPFRDRPVEENLDLFQRMKAGEYPDGARVLRAKIDMSSANLNMRDPVMYRIMRAHHHRTGDADRLAALAR